MHDHDDRSRVLHAHAALVADGVLESVSHAPEDIQLWVDCELASFVENRFHEQLDPRTLDAGQRACWASRALGPGERLLDPHRYEELKRSYWILDGGERVGTIALDLSLMGAQLVTLSSLYVFPSCRGHGLGRRVIRRAQQAVREHGAWGLRVPTYWTWQRPVHFYLGLGMWVANWKHSLVFCSRKDLPEYQVVADEREARFGVVSGGVVEELLLGTRLGDRLGWTELPAFQVHRREESEIFYSAPGTFALALAVRGFPLVRSDEAWSRRSWSSDGGEVEGLAYKIEIFEALDRRSGFEVRTPRIPGLAYRDYALID